MEIHSNSMQPGFNYRWSGHPEYLYFVKTFGGPVFGQHREYPDNEFEAVGFAEHDYYVRQIGYRCQPPKAQTNYKYNEPALLEDLRVYVDDTYGEHYAQTSFQSTEVIIDSGHGVGFCLGNVLKYANRYGRKEGRNRKDLFKILHYTLIAIFIHDKEVK